MRTVTWEDPMIAIKAARQMTGLEMLQGLRQGEVPPPPIAMLLGFEPPEAEPGRVLFALNPAEFHYNPMGTVHGGVTATLLDTAMGCAVQSLLPAGSGFTTIEFKVNFVKSITVKTGRIYCEGKLVHMGGRTAFAEGRVVDEEGTLYAHATTTCMILRPEVRA